MSELTDVEPEAPAVSVVMPIGDGHAFGEPPLADLARYFRDRGWRYELIVVDDVRRGVAQSTGKRVLLLGADLELPVEQFERLSPLVEDGADVAVASRPRPRGLRALRQAPLRAVCRLLGLSGPRDPLSGARLMHGSVARDVYSRLGSHGIAADVEALLVCRLHGYRVAEAPVESARPAGIRPSSLPHLVRARWRTRDGAEDRDLAGPRAAARRRRAILRLLIIADVGATAWWLTWLLNLHHAASPVLYGALVAAQLATLLQIAGYWFVVWRIRPPQRRSGRLRWGEVDVVVTTFNEPLDVVERTVEAAKAVRHPHRTVVLDDGRRPEVAAAAHRHGADCVTRPDNRGAKAGNLNNWLAHSEADFIAVLDADQVPRPEFLDHLMPWFRDRDIAFVQAPQYYANRDETFVAGGAMDQQEIFFGPLCEGQNGRDAVLCCGTNVVIRRAALDQVGGFREDSVTEDAVTGLEMHARGWRSRYVPERLAEGLAPEDLGAYLSQQQRWARGNLELLLRFRPLTMPLPLALRLQYAWGASHYVLSLANLVHLVLPCLFLFAGLHTVRATASNDFVAHFLPYILVSLFIFARSLGGRLRFRAIQFSFGLFPVYLAALLAVLSCRQGAFRVTPKRRRSGSFYRLVAPQLLVAAVTVAAIAVGINHYRGPSTVTNVCWALVNLAMLSAVIRAARPNRDRASPGA